MRSDTIGRTIHSSLPAPDVVAALWLEAETLQAVAKPLGCTREWVRQACNNELPSWLVALHKRRLRSRKRLKTWAKAESKRREIALKRTPWGRAEGKFTRGPGCWEWTAAKTGKGYGHLYDGTGQSFAHRHVYEMYRGPIPEGLTLDHLCKNTSCVNPDHLEPVTLRVNILRSGNPTAINARKTHCKHGHELTDDNIYQSRLPDRICIQCGRRRSAEAGRKRRQSVST